MKRNRRGTKPVICSLVLLALSACGGNGKDSDAPSTLCTGTAQALFQAMQGTYSGQVNADFSSGSTLALTRGRQYPVTVSGANCAVSFIADDNTKIQFAFGNDNTGTISTLTGLSPTQTINDPSSLDLAGVQYNAGVTSGALAYELERRVKAVSADASVADGDLFLSIYGLNDSHSVYGLDLPVSTRR